MKLDWLEKLDRRWLFLMVAVLVMGPLLKPLGEDCPSVAVGE